MELHSETVLGCYRVIRLLGRGGMGIVYEVEHLSLGVHYAMKVFNRSLGEDERLRERFRAEGRLLARLDHPHLVHVHDLGVDEASGVMFFIMDLVVYGTGDPCTLEDVRRAGGFTEDQVRDWFADIRSCLEYVHQQGVVHRDIKLENILLNADGRAVVSDFGISRIFNRDLRREAGLGTTTFASRTGWNSPVMGTMGYLPPEVKSGDLATEAADLYSFGVALFRLLTGIWYETGTDALSLLEPFEYNWDRVLPPLLSVDPELRVMPLAMPVRKTHFIRWRLGMWLFVVVILGVLLLVTGQRLFKKSPGDDFESLFAAPDHYVEILRPLIFGGVA